MKSKQETFSDLLDRFGYRYDLRMVFEDFLSMTLCAVTQIPGVGKSHYEDQYLKTIEPYAKDDLRHLFPKMVARLIIEMEERAGSSQGNDVLGEYYEQHFCKRNSGQFFTPMPVCHLMAQCTCNDETYTGEIKRVIDPTCGSGRMLLAGAERIGKQHEFYGIDLDHTCVKMTALNLFLNGMFHSEVMWADALRPGDFRISYKMSFLPFGIFQIREKEQSRLWHLYTNSFARMKSGSEEKQPPVFRETGNDFTVPPSQMTLF